MHVLGAFPRNADIKDPILEMNWPMTYPPTKRCGMLALGQTRLLDLW